MTNPKIKSYKINMSAIDKKIAKSRKYSDEADKLVNQKFREAKTQLMEEFNVHPVTQEIEGGPTAANSSGTLNGYGNLFSFIGFPKGANPVNSVRVFLQTRIALRKKTVRKDSLTKEYSVNIPTLESFSFASMPWESGSWVREVETGISGFNYYMTKASAASRSGTAIQIDGKLRALNASTGVPYMTKILKRFARRILSR